MGQVKSGEYNYSKHHHYIKIDERAIEFLENHNVKLISSIFIK